MDIMGYETCFAWISNELNNLPLCLGSKYRDLGSLDLLTPNWVIHGRANRMAMYHRKPVAHTGEDGRHVPGVAERLVQ
jgi:hypothetical protein